jgi:TetR/AcrR family transcriptional repressor of nem operon
MAKTKSSADPGATATRILDVAERLAQTRGFNGFSYADIAAEVGITKASLHYHFPAKADLGAKLVARYRESFQAAIKRIGASDEDPLAKLQKYAQVYQQVLGADRMCLCGMLAAEYATLPEPMQRELRQFFDENEAWLVELLESGRSAGALEFDGEAKDIAGLLTGALEGSMLLARSYRDNSRFGTSASQLVKTFAPRRPSPGAKSS